MTTDRLYKFLGKERSIPNAISISTIIIAIISCFLMAGVWGINAYRNFESETKLIKNNFITLERKNLQEQTAELSNYITFKNNQIANKAQTHLKDQVYKIYFQVSNLYNYYKNKSSRKELLELFRHAINPSSYNHGSGDFFMMDMKGNMLINTFSPQLEGNNISTFHKEKKMYRDMISLAKKKGEGAYIFHTDSTKSKESEHYYFIKYIELFDVFVGMKGSYKGVEKVTQSEILSRLSHIHVTSNGNLSVWKIDSERPVLLMATQEDEFIKKKIYSGEFISSLEGNTLLTTDTYVSSHHKLLHIEKIPHLNWLIVNSISTKQLETTTVLREKESYHHMIISFIILASVIIFYLIFNLIKVKHLSRKIQTSFHQFVVFFNQPNSDFRKINMNEIHYEEFKKLALLANSMIEQREHFQKEIQNQQAYIHDQKEKLEDNNKMLTTLIKEKEDIMGVVAHDLRSPLNKINGLVQLIEMENNLNDQQQEFIKHIYNILSGGNRLIKDMLYLHSVTQDNLNLYLEKITLKNILQENIDTFHPIADQKNIKLNCEFIDHDLEIITDPQILTRVLDNLVSNAIKFSPFRTSIDIKIESDRKDYFKIHVIDQGPGISEEEQKKLFRKFQRLSNRPTAGETTTGIGLAIVKALVEKLNGYISVKSTLLKGTTFTIAFPIFQDQNTKSIKKVETV